MSCVNDTESKHLNMTIYASVVVFKIIFDDLDYFSFVCTRAAAAYAAQ